MLLIPGHSRHLSLAWDLEPSFCKELDSKYFLLLYEPGCGNKAYCVGCGDSSVGKILAIQNEDLNLILRTRIKKPGSVTHAYNSSAGEMEKGGLLELTGQPPQLT